MRTIFTLALLGTMLALGGCVINVNADHDEEESNWKSKQQSNARAISAMEIGRSKIEIEAELGTADFNDAFEGSGGTYRVLFYRTRHLHSDGRTTRDETTPIVFHNGNVVGWGDSALAHYTDD